MKKILKILGLVLLTVILAVVGFGLFINSAGIPTYEVNPPESYPVQSDSATIEEGARMASLMCAVCHMSKDRKLGGNYMADATDFGKIYAPNISKHPDSKLQAYSNEELVYLLRTGIKRDGSYAPPYMAKYPNLSDKDMNALLAFLRSDHPMMDASDNVVPVSEPSFLTKFLTRTLIKPLPYPDGVIPEPNYSDPVEFGKYLSTAKFDCYQCHSQDFKTVDVMVPENTPGFFAGGNHLYRKDGELVLSPNLTMDKETGIGNYTEEEFIKAVKYGLAPDGREALTYPMLPFTQMTEDEVKAVWAYLNTLEPVRTEALLKE